MAAPAGSVVRLYVDLSSSVEIGDQIETGTGRRYGVMHVRVQQRGKCAGRQHLTCLVLGAEDEAGERTHRIRWYRR